MKELQYEVMRMRMEAMEARIAVLEEKLAGKAAREAILEAMRVEHGDEMTKQTASEVLGVTRCTIYNMIGDGRLEENENGRIVTDSVISYMNKRAMPKKR